MRRVDAHHHLWDLSTRDQPWTAGLPVLRRSFPPAEVVQLFADSGFDGGIVVQTGADRPETVELLHLCAAVPQILGAVGWVDLTQADVGDRLSALLEEPGGRALLGIRHQVQAEPDPHWLCRSDVRQGLLAVGSLGLTYDIVVRRDQLECVSEVVPTLPGTRFVLDHCGNPDVAAPARGPWSRELRQLAQHPNVAVKLSGLVTQAGSNPWIVADLRPFAETVLDLFGTTRVLFGSDWPVCLLATSYDRVVAIASELVEHLSSDEQAQVFGGSAQAWYLDPE